LLNLNKGYFKELFLKIRFSKPGRAKGFTLIELLVVIGIIAILATIIFVYFREAKAKARDSKRKGELRQIENALVIYQDNNSGSYPVSLQDLVPQYVPIVPQDPKTGVPYFYKTSSSRNYYEIDANLEINLDGAADIDGGNQPFPVYEIGSDLTLLP